MIPNKSRIIFPSKFLWKPTNEQSIRAATCLWLSFCFFLCLFVVKQQQQLSNHWALFKQTSLWVVVVSWSCRLRCECSLPPPPKKKAIRGVAPQVHKSHQRTNGTTHGWLATSAYVHYFCSHHLHHNDDGRLSPFGHPELPVYWLLIASGAYLQCVLIPFHWRSCQLCFG